MRILRWRGPLVVVMAVTVTTACVGAAEVSDGPQDVGLRAAAATPTDGVSTSVGEPIRIGGTFGEAVLPVAERNEMVLFNGGFAGIERFAARTGWSASRPIRSQTPRVGSSS
jgi:hypothetical protein